MKEKDDLRNWFTDNINISKQWIDDLKDYQIKVLLLTSVLADNNLAFRGTLKTMCEWLGIESCSNNNKRIKQSLLNLSNNGYIFYKVEGRIHHVSISNKGMKSKQIYKVRKKWIEVFKKYCKENKNKNFSIDWIKVLRVFIYLYYQKGDEILTEQKIAQITNTSDQTVSNALKAILACDLKGVRIEKKVIKDSYYDEKNIKQWRTRGQKIVVIILFDEIQ